MYSVLVKGVSVRTAEIVLAFGELNVPATVPVLPPVAVMVEAPPFRRTPFRLVETPLRTDAPAMTPRELTESDTELKLPAESDTWPA